PWVLAEFPFLIRGGTVLRHNKVGGGGIAVAEAQDHPVIVFVGAVFDGGAADHSPPVPKEPEQVPAAKVGTLGEQIVIELSGEKIEQLAGRHAYFVPRHDSASVIGLRPPGGAVPVHADPDIF